MKYFRKIKFAIDILYFLYLKTNKNYINGILKAINPNLKISLVDIGAAGGIEPRWGKIIDFINYIGFEPDNRSFLKLSQKDTYHKLYNVGVWSSEGLISINLCKNPQVSSFYTPNYNLLNRFPNKERFLVEKIETINVITIDNALKCECDFIKIDIQGGELEVLKGANRILGETLGLELEVEFIEMYKNQPLFGEICKYLETKNFHFMDFTNLCRWERNAHEGIGQNIFGDALFLKTPEFVLKNYSNDLNKIEKYLTILVLYRRYDIIEIILNGLNENFIKKLKHFVKKFDKMKEERELVLKINSIYNHLLNRKIDLPIKSHILY